MALFCPTCHNLLLVRDNPSLQFYCTTCPYILPITEKVTRKMTLKVKPLPEPISSTNEEEGPRTQGWFLVGSKKSNLSTHTSFLVICPHCSYKEAFFYQIQTRSCDEPMTTFFKCCSCKLQWRE
jgi:DNA-directed RNA polymerase III subunit RPC11